MTDDDGTQMHGELGGGHTDPREPFDHLDGKPLAHWQALWAAKYPDKGCGWPLATAA
jgi:hypothetical protein